jgi:hypothetical protein
MPALRNRAAGDSEGCGVQRFTSPFCHAIVAKSGLFRSAIFVTSISIVCRKLVRCFESGVRPVMFAELLFAPHHLQQLIVFS